MKHGFPVHREFKSFALDHSSLSVLPRFQHNCSLGMESSLKMWLYSASNCKSDTSSVQPSALRVRGESYWLSRNTHTRVSTPLTQHGASAMQEQPRRVPVLSSPLCSGMATKHPAHTTPSAPAKALVSGCREGNRGTGVLQRDLHKIRSTEESWRGTGQGEWL